MLPAAAPRQTTQAPNAKSGAALLAPFALGAPLGGGCAAITRLLEGARCALPKVAPRQTTVRLPVVQAHPALAVASYAPFWHKEPRSTEPVPQIVGPVAGALAENALGVALVDIALLVTDARCPIAHDL